MMKARISDLEPQDIFLVNPTTHGLRRLAIREVFGKLKHRGQGQTRGCLGGLPPRRKEGSELRVLIDGSEMISDLDVHVAPRERGTGDSLGVFWDGIGDLGVQG